MSQIKDDDLITAALLRRFADEAAIEGSGQYYGIVRCHNGDLIVHHPFSPALAIEQLIWASDVLRSLNKELHHDGAWVVVFTHPQSAPPGETVIHIGHREYNRYALLWIDSDGDAQFAVEWVRDESELCDWADVLLAGIESVMAKCATAWQLWNLHMRDVLDPADGQT